MAYQVDKFNGTFLVSVDDGTIDTTTDIRFVGKNYAGYGEVQNENFLHLLENFSNATPPPKVIAGQIWFDSANKKLKFYDGIQFRLAGGAEARATAPSGLTPGDFWFDTSAQQLYTYNGTEYVLIGPETAPDIGSSALIPQVVKDTEGLNHSIGRLVSGEETILILSKDEFTLDSILNPIAGFTRIKKGFTLINTPTTGVTTSDHFYWGTASNSLKLQNYSASDFILRDDPDLPNNSRFNDSGFYLGDSNDIRFYVENGDEPAIENVLGNTFKIKIRVSSSDIRQVAVFRPNDIVPGTTNFISLGSTTNRWANVHSVLLTGNLTGNVTGNLTGNVTGNLFGDSSGVHSGNVIGDLIGTANNSLALNGSTSDTSATPGTIALRDSTGNITATQFIGIADNAIRLKIDDTASDSDPSYRSAKTTATANTIAARDSSGNLTAVVFNGTATAARYADLAEKYLADQEYDVGTVVTVGGTAEVRACVFGDRAIGVVSENPAFMMNKDLDGGTYIALKGRVPVKVIGSIRKGDRLVATENGHAIASSFHTHVDVFAISLEDDARTESRLIEAIII